RHRDAGIPAWAADGELGVDAEARFFGPAVGGGWERRPGPGEGAVHVSFASLEPSSVRIEPVFFDSMSPPPVTGEKALYCSFNYYMTDNLLEWYSENDRRPIAWRRFPLDYVYVTGEAAGFESPPLYRKTLLGCTSSGRLVAGAYSFSSVTLRDGRGDVVGRFSGEALDPADPDAPGLFLPGKGPRRVGAGLHCTSFIHDEPWDSRPGPVEVPPFGVVVASASPLAGAGRFSWSVEWADLPCAKEELSWLMGGFNCLVEDGVDLCPTVTAAAERLEREGWTNPLSTQTQETQLEADIRQPRCCVGWTRGGQAIVMAVSGRSALSAGARFGDLSSLASLLAAERGDGLEFLVNVDGGASAMLCAVGDGERAMLSYPSPSDNNPAGVARKVPSLLRIAILEKP
ncbi:MAG: phosphodiester glycosidase family protein, partial [Spirochaetes bacterium]|nr:phosphodiester glycosidase family protein [Spirochaetota bacterium]